MTPLRSSMNLWRKDSPRDRPRGQLGDERLPLPAAPPRPIARRKRHRSDLLGNVLRQSLARQSKPDERATKLLRIAVDDTAQDFTARPDCWQTRWKRNTVTPSCTQELTIRLLVMRLLAVGATSLKSQIHAR